MDTIINKSRYLFMSKKHFCLYTSYQHRISDMYVHSNGLCLGCRI